jgi:hypothetical protein
MTTPAVPFRWRRFTVAVAALTLTAPGGVAQAHLEPGATAAVAGPAVSPPPASTPPSAQPAGPTPAPSAAPSSMPAPAVTGDIRDIRGPIHLPPPVRWPWWLGGAVVAAALGYGAWRWWKHRARVAALLPYQIALARLEEARALMQPEQAREFSIMVSEIVRQFIEVRFTVRAARRTTEEFLRDLLAPSDALLTSHRESLADFLRHCDLAKFARWQLSTAEMTTMLQSAHNFVLQSGPTPPPEPVASARTPSQNPPPSPAPAQPAPIRS